MQNGTYICMIASKFRRWNVEIELQHIYTAEQRPE